MEGKAKNVIKSLKNSPKGQLVYDSDWTDKGKLQSVIEECTSHPQLAVSPRTSSPRKPQANPSTSQTSSESPTILKSDDEVETPTGDHYEEDGVEIHRQRLAKSLYDMEHDIKLKVMTAVEVQRRKFEEHTKRLWEEAEQKLVELMIGHEDELQSELQQVKANHHMFSEEVICSQRKLRQDHKRHAKRQEAIYQEAQRKQQEEEVERQRRLVEDKRRLEEMLSQQTHLLATDAIIIKTIAQSPYAKYFTDTINKCLPIMEQMKNKVESEIAEARKSSPSSKQLMIITEVSSKANDVLRFVQNQEENAKKKAEEVAKQQQEQSKKEQEAAAAAAAAATPAAPSPVAPSPQPAPSKAMNALQQAAQSLKPQEAQALGAMPESILDYSRKCEFLSTVQQATADLVGDPKNKKVKFDLQKAVNIPVNAISPTSGSHLRDKLERICDLLSGKTVTAGGQKVAVSQHAMGAIFCKDLFAKKIVKQGDEQISCNADSAFAVAAVTVGVMCQFGDVGDLLLAHLYRACPYSVPYYHPKPESHTEQEYYELLGYRYSEGGEREKQDKFLKRMSGLIRLYAAIIVSLPPPGTPNPHPHALQHGWAWLARVMNLNPRPDITATMLHEFLQVTGASLLKEYGKQFVKLISMLVTDYLPKIRAVTPDGAGGPITRLEIFLNKILTSKAVAPPEGFLTSNFWFT